MSPAILILAAVFAIVATVLAFVFIVPESKSARLGKFGKFLHDTVNFKYLIIEKVLQALYIFATSYIILQGFFMLFYVERSYSWFGNGYSNKWYGGYGLLLMILGPIAVRLVYELLMMSILLIKNVIQINGKLKSDDGNDAPDIFTVPTIERAPVQYTAPMQQQVPVQQPTPVQQPKKPMFCSKCGTPLAEDGTCHNCAQYPNS